MQQATDTYQIRERILDLVRQKNLVDPCYADMLDYTIDLFETQGLGADYYGYHNINHELEVTYVSLLATHQDLVEFSDDDIKHLYVAALFHDFDPLKRVDKPHEESVLRFISIDRKLQQFIKSAGIDIEIIKSLILRTTYPWSGDLRRRAEEDIRGCFGRSERTKWDRRQQQHVMGMGRYLSVIDRIGGYALGDFTKALKMAKMNAHALAWNSTLIIKRSVAYFEELLNVEDDMIKAILGVLPRYMRENFYNTVLSFFKARQKEISIQADHAYENLKLVPTIESKETRSDRGFINTLHDIFLELPTPLQFAEEMFDASIIDPQTLLVTLRINDGDGEVIGYAKGGPLESYNLREEINDKNHGLSNTIFLEPMVIRMGYWGLGGGSGMRNMFITQAGSKKFKYLTSFALRDVVSYRIGREKAEFVAKFDPERWDYYRISI